MHGDGGAEGALLFFLDRARTKRSARTMLQLARDFARDFVRDVAQDLSVLHGLARQFCAPLLDDHEQANAVAAVTDFRRRICLRQGLRALRAPRAAPPRTVMADPAAKRRRRVRRRSGTPEPVRHAYRLVRRRDAFVVID